MASDAAAGGELAPDESGPLRADAQASQERILSAARALDGDRRASMSEIAAAAQVSRSTLYRHFPSRQHLSEALARQAQTTAPVTPLPYQSPGRLGRSAPMALEVTHVLDEVPPHLIADQLVAEARRVAGVAIALYVVDIDGSELVRLAGSEDFPERLPAPPALGPEIVPEGLPAYYHLLHDRLPRCTAVPLWLRGRVLGLLLAIGAPVASLEDVAKQGAAALELANDYTDLIESARRRKPTTAAAEVQHHLLPPRIVRVTGAQVAGGLLPTYEVGGDWFDFCENRDGAWIAIADAAGTGATAAGLGAAALGALRAARRSGQDLTGAVTWIDEVIRGLADPAFSMSAIVARWHAPTATLAWINCGHPTGYLVAGDRIEALPATDQPRLGMSDGPPELHVQHLRLQPTDRVVLLTRGILDRTVEGGGTFGEDRLRAAIAGADAPTAAATAMAIQQAVSDCWTEPLQDDATVVVLAVDP